MATLNAIYKIAADITSLQSGVTKGVAVMEGMEKKASAMGSTLTTVGKVIGAAFTIDAVKNLGQQALDTASQVQDAADKMGIGAEAVQRLQFAAEQGGASLDNVATAIAKMSKNLTEGGKGTVGQLESLGLSIDALKAMKPDEAFVAIADAISKVPDPLRQSALAQELLGKGAMALMPAIKAGFTEIGKAAPVMSAAMVRSADDTGDAIAAMEKRLNTLRAQALLPLLNLFTSMPGPVQTALGALNMLAPAITGLASIITMSGGLSAVLAGLGTMFTVTLPAAFAAVLPFLGPIGIIAVAVGAVLLAWKNWDTIVGFVKGVYTAVKEFIIDKIIPVLAAGGPLLGPVGMVVTIWKNWDRITEIAKGVYMGVKEWMVDKFNAIVASIQSKVDAVTGFFQGMYDKVVGHSYVPDMIKGIDREFGKLQKVMVEPTLASIKQVVDAFGSIESVVKKVETSIGGMRAGFGEMTSGNGWKSILGGFTSIAGGISGIVSAAQAAISIGKTLFSIFDRDKGRDLVENFVKQFGGFDGIQQIFAEMGEEGARLWKMLTQGKDVHDSPEAARRAIDEVTAAIERFKAQASSMPSITFHTEGTTIDPEGFANGSNGIRDFGSGTLAMLHGREAVVTEAQMRQKGGGGGASQVVIPVSVGGQHLETIIVDVLSGAIRRRQLVGAV